MTSKLGRIAIASACAALSAGLPVAARAQFIFPAGSWGTYGPAAGQFEYPLRIAVDASDVLYVVDQLNNRVQKFSSDGSYIGTWGTGAGGLTAGIAVNSGNAYVVDQGGHRVLRYNAGTGSLLGEWGSRGSGPGQFLYPFGVATSSSPNGPVFVADRENHRVQVFNYFGGYVRQWGSLGSGNGQFQLPSGLAVDDAGNVFVADQGNHRIQKFTTSGAYIRQWGTLGSGNGQFQFPGDVAVSRGLVYVTDYGNQRVEEFSTDGIYVRQWGTFGTDVGQFQFPAGITVDSANDIFVVDLYNHRIQKFEVGTPTRSTSWGQVMRLYR